MNHFLDFDEFYEEAEPDRLDGSEGVQWDWSVDRKLNPDTVYLSRSICMATWTKIIFAATLIPIILVAGFLVLLTRGSAFFDTGMKLDYDLINAAADLHQAETADLSSEEISVDGFSCQVNERFPKKIRRWCELISKHSQKRGLPPDLVAAVIFQESGGNPEAYSHSGAVGLMQVMPRDGLAASFVCGNGPCFANRPSTYELLDPDFNIAYGTKLLSGLVARNSSLREGLRSYGPMDVGYSYADKVLGIYERFSQ